MQETKITLPSGFTFDYTNLLGTGRISTSDLTQVQDLVKQAAKQIEVLRSTGEVEGHLSKDGKKEPVYFTRLPYVQAGHPNTPESLQALAAYGAKLRQECQAVLLCGIGGSYLGGRVFEEVFGPTQGQGGPQIHFTGNNLDSEAMSVLMAQLVKQALDRLSQGGEPLEVALIPISKSGTTLEPTAAFLYFYEQLTGLASLFKLRVAVVTDVHISGHLTTLARTHGWPSFDIAEGVGGRFSVLANPGLLVAAILGLDLAELLRGARDMDAWCQSAELMENPALLNATLKFVADQSYGCEIEVFMPYANKLKCLGEWYVQLLAESLGKRHNKRKEEVFYGRTPVVAIGTTDMHAQTQQHQDGRRNKLIQFVDIGVEEAQLQLQNPFPEVASYVQYQHLSINAALRAAQGANREALNEDARFNATYYLPQLNVYMLGQLFYFLMLSIAYEGALAEVDAFDQPGIEVYKRIMHQKLAAQAVR